jgi:hypothetical protein
MSFFIFLQKQIYDIRVKPYGSSPTFFKNLVGQY